MSVEAPSTGAAPPATTVPAAVTPVAGAVRPPGSPPGPWGPWAAPVFTVVAVAAMAVLRLVVLPHQITPIGYGVPLAVYLLLRDRRWLWIAAGAFAVLSFIEMFLVLPTNRVPEVMPLPARVSDLVMVLLDVAVIAGVVHDVVGARANLERRHRELWAVNRELAAREEEIARQNEELQSQTEELERQSEELRVANEDLAERERTLEALLNLSRALAREPGREATMQQVCKTMGQLLASARPASGGCASASAILEHQGDCFVVRCHEGFGADGPVDEVIPVEKTFASLVLSEGRTAYLHDLSLRADLSVPRPREGPPFAAVLAAPLRVGGWPVGTLEVYSHEKTAWSPVYVALLESLAAQASVSLEAADLFEQTASRRRRLEAMLRAMPIGVAVANADATEVRLNPAGAALFGVPPDTNVAPAAAGAGGGGAGASGATVSGATVSGATGPWQLFSGGEPLPPEQYPLRRALRGEEVRAQECEVLLGTGRRMTLLTHASPIAGAGGEPEGAVAAFADITSQKELQRELDTRRREAEEASVRKTRFLAAISHDIRTPANAISLLAELIRRTAANPAMAADVPDLARDLHGSAVSLVNLVSDVLDVARFDSDRIDIQESEFQLANFLSEESQRMQPLARHKGLDLQFQTAEASLWLRTDRTKLSRILGNLVGNAIKFTDKGGVRVDLARTDAGGVEFRVTDTGVGIAPEHQRHIFDEFFQLRNPERDRNKGTGLGLTICKRLVDAMGGTLDVRSNPSEGSTFIVSLPSSVVLQRG